MLWEARYQGVYHPKYRPSIAVSPNGAGAFVASDVHTSRGFDYLIEAYNARVFVTGGVLGRNGSREYLTAAYHS